MVKSNMSLSDQLLVLNVNDNIALLRRPQPAGTVLVVNGQDITLTHTLGMGHKIALGAIAKGEDVLKYGAPIGFAGTDIALGDHVHLHNLTSRYTIIKDMDNVDG